MAKIELYGMAESPAVRTVRMTLEVLGKPYDLKIVNLLKEEHLRPEFLALNPQHNIPTIRDGGFVMNESRAIAAYLADAYGGRKHKGLYPRDPRARARVDQRLQFDQSVLYQAFCDCVHPMYLHNVAPERDAYDNMRKALQRANDFIKFGWGYADGSGRMTVADLAMAATYSTISEVARQGALGDVDVAQYEELADWFARVRAEVPNHDVANGQGAAMVGSGVRFVDLLFKSGMPATMRRLVFDAVMAIVVFFDTVKRRFS